MLGEFRREGLKLLDACGPDVRPRLVRNMTEMAACARERTLANTP